MAVRVIHRLRGRGEGTADGTEVSVIPFLMSQFFLRNEILRLRHWMNESVKNSGWGLRGVAEWVWGEVGRG